LRNNNEGAKSETSHFSGTNYNASIVRVSTNSTCGEEYFGLEPE